MRHKILILFMSVLMLLGLTQTVFAEDGQYYSGTASVGLSDMIGVEEINVVGYYVNGRIDGEFVTSEGHHFKWWASGLDTADGREQPSYVLIDGQYATYEHGGCSISSDGSLYFYSKSRCEDPDEIFFYLNMYMDPTDEPILHEISTVFTGTGLSDRGDYTLALAGYFDKELIDGTHELNLSEISGQTISIVAHNNANGINRVMNQSTIEEMAVTISGGQMVSATVRGRVQTNGGTLDRYTTTIQP